MVLAGHFVDRSDWCFVTQKGKSRARSVPEACTPSKMCIYSMLRIPSAVSPFFPLSTANLAHIDEPRVQNKRTPRSVGGRPTGACGCCELLGPATSLRCYAWNVRSRVSLLSPPGGCPDPRRRPPVAEPGRPEDSPLHPRRRHRSPP